MFPVQSIFNNENRASSLLSHVLNGTSHNCWIFFWSFSSVIAYHRDVGIMFDGHSVENLLWSLWLVVDCNGFLFYVLVPAAETDQLRIVDLFNIIFFEVVWKVLFLISRPCMRYHEVICSAHVTMDYS